MRFSCYCIYKLNLLKVFQNYRTICNLQPLMKIIIGTFTFFFAMITCIDDCSVHFNYNNHTNIAKMKLWPGLGLIPIKENLDSRKVLIGLFDAMERIYQNQNPPDCSKAKYLISEPWYQGFGSEIHVYGVALSIALQTNRVFLQEGGWNWRFKNDFCRNQNNKKGRHTLLCYYEPFSKCTMKDAISVMLKSNSSTIPDNGSRQWNSLWDKDLQHLVLNKYGQKGKWKEIAEDLRSKQIIVNDLDCYNRWNKYLKDFIHSQKAKHDLNLKKKLEYDDPSLVDYISKSIGIIPLHRVQHIQVNPDESFNLILNKLNNRLSDNTVMLANEAIEKYHKLVPRMDPFPSIYRCNNIDKGFEFMWWRAIAATFILRPNKLTLVEIEKHSDPLLKSVNGKCISTYVRHGDKTIREMKYVPFDFYATTAMKIWSSSSDQLQKQKLFYLGTEDPQVHVEANDWGRKNNIIIRYSNMSRLILSDKRSTIRQHNLEQDLPKNHEMEYISYLLHLSEIIRCDIVICTVPSNYCRLIDELRTTIGAKANFINADLSQETCKKPPCIRNYGLPNYVGPVYDPLTRIW